MTKDDIVSAAFRVWGEELFQKNSLSDVAAELGCTKPALYRHFGNKNELREAMFRSCFDRFAAFLLPHFERARAVDDENTALVIMARAIGEFLALNKGEFHFFLMYVYGSAGDEHDLNLQFIQRGIELGNLNRGRGGLCHPSKMQMVMSMVIFFVAHRYVGEGCLAIQGAKEDSEESALPPLLDALAVTIERGFGFIKERVEKVDFARLENAVSLDTGFTPEKDELHLKLLKAIGEVLAEAGPFEASVEMFAKKSGLSKSSLYTHFSSRNEMVMGLFTNEFERILHIAEYNKAKSDIPEEQLYLVIIAIAQYLRKHTIILRAIDKIRTRRKEFLVKKYGNKEDLRHIGTDLFAGICAPTVHGKKIFGPSDTAHILPMLVNTLMIRPSGLDYADIGNESIRILYRFLTLGLSAAGEEPVGS
jgi:AcrR family transcriptional regulator